MSLTQKKQNYCHNKKLIFSTSFCHTLTFQTCQVIQRFGVSSSVECQRNRLTPVQFPDPCQMVFPSGCLIAQQSRGTHEETFLFYTLIHLSSFTVRHTLTQMLLALSGTTFHSLIYCPVTCLFFCIYRPFTEQIYLQRNQHPKHD